MRNIFFDIGVSSSVGAYHTRARRAFHGAFGETDRASQPRQQRKVNNKRMLGESSFQ